MDAHPELASKFIELKVKRKDFSETMQHKFDECEQIGGNIDAAMREYLGDVYSVDLNVGRVLKALDELGLSENTIVVFSSDHGPAPVILGKKGHREFSQNMLGYAAQYRGGKHTQLEGGLRVPFIIRWPGHVPAGRVDEKNVMSFMDWMPTLASIVGSDELPELMDGEDVSDIWMGETRERVKTQYWKASSTGSSPSMREGEWKLHFNRKNSGKGTELYDLSVDPSESRNVADDHPEVLAELSMKLKAWVAELPKSYEKNK